MNTIFLGAITFFIAIIIGRMIFKTYIEYVARKTESRILRQYLEEKIAEHKKAVCETEKKDQEAEDRNLMLNYNFSIAIQENASIIKDKGFIYFIN